MICESEPLRADVRRFNYKGLFGIIWKAISPLICAQHGSLAAHVGSAKLDATRRISCVETSIKVLPSRALVFDCTIQPAGYAT
jgi:hypothetical protein